jgi:cytochrome P450
MSLFLIGGSETFPKVFANLARRCSSIPIQRAAVAADPSLAPDAMIEALRFDMPTQFLGRTIVRDVELHGEKLRAGEACCSCTRRPTAIRASFPDPDVFDIARRPPRILSFGHGTHSCLGIHAAKAEGRHRARGAAEARSRSTKSTSRTPNAGAPSSCRASRGCP